MANIIITLLGTGRDSVVYEMAGQAPPMQHRQSKLKYSFNPLVKLNDKMKQSYLKSGHVRARFREVKSHCMARNLMLLLLILGVQIK